MLQRLQNIGRKMRRADAARRRHMPERAARAVDFDDASLALSAILKMADSYTHASACHVDDVGPMK